MIKTKDKDCGQMATIDKTIETFQFPTVAQSFFFPLFLTLLLGPTLQSIEPPKDGINSSGTKNQAGFTGPGCIETRAGLYGYVV